jgi:hypothetical protein
MTVLQTMSARRASNDATGVVIFETIDHLVSYAGTIRIRYDGFAMAISALLDIQSR